MKPAPPVTRTWANEDVMAGILPPAVSDWQWLLGTNTMGAVHTMRAFIPLMVDQGPDAEGASSHFVTTASIASLLTVENSPAYVASKFAALSVTEVLELQLQDAGAPVMAHAVCPAIVRTDLLDCARHRHPGSFDPADPYYASPDFRRRAQGAAQEMATVGMPVEQAVTTILDEVEKTLLMVDLEIARDYASLVPDENARNSIFPMIEAEYALTREMALRVSGGRELAERFPLFRDRLKGRLPTINHVSREQVELLARFRSETDEDRKEAVKSALLLSINCIAVGSGATG